MNKDTMQENPSFEWEVMWDTQKHCRTLAHYSDFIVRVLIFPKSLNFGDFQILIDC
jgi:hypothetical protein